MSKEIGPREAALRKAREENYEREQARQRAERKAIGFAPSQDTLKALNAKIETIKPKPKGKRK